MSPATYLFATLAVEALMFVKWYFDDKREAELERKEAEHRRMAAERQAEAEAEGEPDLDEDNWYARTTQNPLHAFCREYDVVGESFDNEDGTYRQDILRDFAQGERGFFKALASIDEFDYQGERALAVKINDQQIGCIARKDLGDVFRDLKTADEIRLKVVGGGDQDLYGAKVTLVCNG
nr:MAG TPA: hypothetical protein [Caudoviricetes sp.]